MKKNLLYFILLVCFCPLTTLGIDAKKKSIPQTGKLSLSSSAEFGIVKELINYHILNGDIVSVDLDAHAQKSGMAEDSVPYFKTGMEYLPNQVNQIYSTWDPISQSWDETLKDEIYYDTDPWSPDSSIYFDIDTTTGNWVFGRRNIYTYNTAGQETEHLAFIYNFETQSWDNDLKTVSEYDSNEKLISETIYLWLPPDNDWLGLSKDTFIWSGNLQIITESKHWEPSNETWDTSRKTKMDYDDLDRLELQVDSVWDYFADGYTPQWKAIYTYVDESEFIDSAFSFNWDDDLALWTTGAMDIYNYRTNKELVASIDSYTPYMGTKSGTELQNMQKQMTTVYVYDNNDVTGMVQNNVPNIKVYPNPITDKVIVVIPDWGKCSLEVFDIRGKLLVTKSTSSPSTTINTEGFENGMYFLRINNNEKQTTKKIIKH